MSVGWAILASLPLLGAAFGQGSRKDPLKLTHEAGKFELTLPEGHVLKDSAQKTLYLYERTLGPANWQWVRLKIVVGTDRLPQEGLPTNPRLIPALRDLPGEAELRKSPLPWKGVEILAADYRYLDEEEEMEVFGYAAVVPLIPRAIMIDVRASTEYEFNVREDLKSIIASIEGETDWLTPEDEEKLEYLIWPGIAGIVVGLSYFPVWLLFFRGFPWRAHGLRVAWLLLAGALFISGFMLSLTFGEILERGGRDAPILCWALIALPATLTFIALAFRRIVLYIES